MNPKKKTVAQLVLASIAMFAFGFALVPLYTVICDITGLNGKTSVLQESLADPSGDPIAKRVVVDNERTITVEFITILNQSLPMEFVPLQNKMTVVPGEVTSIDYRVKNLTANPMVVQAIPSMTPTAAASSFTKIECFCFDNQTLEAHEEKIFTMRFYVDSRIPKNIQTITLAYTLFNVGKNTS